MVLKEDPGTATVTLHFNVQSRLLLDVVVVVGDRKLDPAPVPDPAAASSPTTSHDWIERAEDPDPISMLDEQSPESLASSRLPCELVVPHVSLVDVSIFVQQI